MTLNLFTENPLNEIKSINSFYSATDQFEYDGINLVSRGFSECNKPNSQHNVYPVHSTEDSVVNATGGPIGL